MSVAGFIPKALEDKYAFRLGSVLSRLYTEFNENTVGFEFSWLEQVPAISNFASGVIDVENFGKALKVVDGAFFVPRLLSGPPKLLRSFALKAGLLQPGKVVDKTGKLVDEKVHSVYELTRDTFKVVGDGLSAVRFLITVAMVFPGMVAYSRTITIYKNATCAFVSLWLALESSASLIRGEDKYDWYRVSALMCSCALNFFGLCDMVLNPTKKMDDFVFAMLLVGSGASGLASSYVQHAKAEAKK